MTVTCPGCKSEITMPDGHAERMEREGRNVRCPNFFCRYVLIKNKESDDDPTSDRNQPD